MSLSAAKPNWAELPKLYQDSESLAWLFFGAFIFKVLWSFFRRPLKAKFQARRIVWIINFIKKKKNLQILNASFVERRQMLFRPTLARIHYQICHIARTHPPDDFLSSTFPTKKKKKKRKKKNVTNGQRASKRHCHFGRKVKDGRFS